MRKAVILFVLILVVALMIAPVSAAPQVTMNASDATPFRGDEITLTIKVSDAGEHKVGGVTVNFDAGVFEMVSGKWLASDLDISYFDAATKDGGFGYLNAKTISGDVFALTLRVKEGVAFNASTVNATLTLSGTSYTISAKVTVTCNHEYSKWTPDGNKHSRTCSVAGCGDKQSKDHGWTNDCDTKCDDCGHTRTITHKYSNTLSKDAKTHYYACTVCGNKKDEEIHKPGEPATEEHAQNCTVCGYEIAPKLDHVHVIVGEQLMDETGHWFDCGTCEEKAEFAEHSYEFECSSACTVCGYIREVQHTLAPEEDRVWRTDETGHWHVCTICSEKVDVQEHISDEDPVAPSCFVCGYDLLHVHVYKDAWTNDGESHWHECACGDRKDETFHTWDEGVLTKEPEKDAYGAMVFTCTVCGGEHTAMVVSAIPELMPWWIACGVLAAALLIAIIFFIVVISKMTRKPAGKFAAR